MQSLIQYLQEYASLNEKFDSKRVNNLIVLIRKTNSDFHKKKYKEMVFKECSKMIIKAINNFFKLVSKISSDKILHTREDIAGECYIIMNNCIEKIDLKQVKKFYYYLNSGLNRGMFRIYQKQYMIHNDVICNNESNEYVLENKGYDHNFDLTLIDLNSLTKTEKAVIKFYLSDKKTNIFLKKHDLTNSEFNYILNSARKKIAKLYGYKN